ncbi:hypothetical protein ACFFP0_03915 [Rhizobium puerariae]|uniref:Ethyl tert-butyl ether degradation protein EthD n=1 Tax=Rhizobium puerariae TaxID=1585791 RepID=A0ABV6ACZ8_9HYPH
MPFCHFVYVQSDDPQFELAPEKIEAARAIVQGLPNLRRGLFFLPARARDYYTDDGPSPRLALQLYYDTLEALEHTISAQGPLRKLADPALLGDVPGLRVTHQAMYARPYDVLDDVHRPDGTEKPCSYLVHYPGTAEDFNAWLDYYLDHHPQIMKTFPRIREIEIYTRVGWRDRMRWERVDYMQRNRLIFDSAAALEAALNSGVRHDMRADFEKFPPFTGSNIHFPMLTEELVGNPERWRS